MDAAKHWGKDPGFGEEPTRILTGAPALAQLL